MGSKLLWRRVWRVLKALDTLHAPAAPLLPRGTELCVHTVSTSWPEHTQRGTHSTETRGRAGHEGRGGEESGSGQGQERHACELQRGAELPTAEGGNGADHKWAPGPSGKRFDVHCGDGCQGSAFTEITGGHTTTGKPMARKFHINKATKPPQWGTASWAIPGVPNLSTAASRAQPCAVCGVFSSVPPDASTGAPDSPVVTEMSPPDTAKCPMGAKSPPADSWPRLLLP